MKQSFQRLCLTTFLLLFAILSYAADEELGVSFSSQGGFYEGSISLTLSCQKGLSIRYTLNGNEPTFLDSVYRHPLYLDEGLCSQSNIYTIQTCPDDFWYVPDTIQKCIVIRAATFDSEGKQTGPVVTHSYFIQSLWQNHSNLPVISLCCDSLSLFDYDTGIMVQGRWKNNYEQRGKAWERLCNVEYYEPNNTGINQEAGVRIHGFGTRNGIQKGLKLYSRKQYGKKRFTHQFFETDETDSFKHLVLKPFGSGLFRDHICTQIAEPLNFETPQSRPVVLFLNGEYWGLYFLKERPDDQFVSDHYGFNKNHINVIESWDGKASSGNSEKFVEMMQWFIQANLSNSIEYEQACRLIDVDCFIDYYCFQLFTCNADWPNNNMRCWQADDGKWRWIFFDGDFCLASYHNILEYTLYNEKNHDISTLVFSKLLMNESFRERFYARYGELLTHEFDPKRTKKYFNDFMNLACQEFDSHFMRFGYSSKKEQFDFQVRFLDDFLSIRMTSAAAMIYKLYDHNNWTFKSSFIPSQSEFNFKNSKRPVFLFRMALQFKEWRYVNYFITYEQYRIHYELKTSKLHQYLKKAQRWTQAKKNAVRRIIQLHF